jgi:hypothetical protein
MAVTLIVLTAGGMKHSMSQPARLAMTQSRYGGGMTGRRPDLLTDCNEETRKEVPPDHEDETGLSVTSVTYPQETIRQEPGHLRHAAWSNAKTLLEERRHE